MLRIPFSLPDVGLREVNGLVYVEDGYLKIRLKDAFLGEFDEDRRTIQVEPDALRSLDLRRGLLRDRLVIVPWRSELLEAVPGEHANAVELRVRRKHRADLEALIDDFDRLD